MQRVLAADGNSYAGTDTCEGIYAKRSHRSDAAKPTHAGRRASSPARRHHSNSDTTGRYNGAAETGWTELHHTGPVAKVTGRARFADDYRVDGMLFAKLLSPMPHARVRRIDIVRSAWPCLV